MYGGTSLLVSINWRGPLKALCGDMDHFSEATLHRLVLSLGGCIWQRHYDSNDGNDFFQKLA